MQAGHREVLLGEAPTDDDSVIFAVPASVEVGAKEVAEGPAVEALALQDVQHWPAGVYESTSR